MNEEILIMVDEIHVWPHAKGIFKKGSCHLTVNGTSEEHIKALHEFAQSIGMKREWFQNTRVSHYDLVESRRNKALKKGAVFVPAKEQVRMRRGK